MRDFIKWFMHSRQYYAIMGVFCGIDTLFLKEN